MWRGPAELAAGRRRASSVSPRSAEHPDTDFSAHVYGVTYKEGLKAPKREAAGGDIVAADGGVNGDETIVGDHGYLLGRKP